MTDKITIGYLVGTSYCGSTLTAFLADEHPRVASVGEVAPTRRRQCRDPSNIDCSCGARIKECPFWTAVFQRVQACGLAFSASKWTTDYRYLNDYMDRIFGLHSSRPILRSIRPALDRFLPFHKSRIQRIHKVNVEFVRAVLETANADVFFDTMKSPLRLHYLRQIDEFDVRVIRVLRDVRAFVRSKARKGMAADSAAHHWTRFQRSVDNYLATIPGSCILTVRYEDLAREPQLWMERIHSHLGLMSAPLPSVVHPATHHILGNSMRKRGAFAVQLNEKWKDELSPDTISKALRLAGSLNESYGYRMDGMVDPLPKHLVEEPAS